MLDSQNGAFPCPVCAKPCDIRETKKDKPYVVCDPCGIQMFVRGRTGIDAFQKLADRAKSENMWARLAKLETRYRLNCPECGHAFWIERGLIKTSWIDGSFVGFSCPQEGCEATVEWEEEQ